MPINLHLKSFVSLKRFISVPKNRNPINSKVAFAVVNILNHQSFVGGIEGGILCYYTFCPI